MDEQLQEDWLDARLRDEAGYIDDAGFTSRVMKQLPPPRQSKWSRSVILFAATLIACAVAFFFAGDFVLNTAAFLVAMPATTVFAIAGFVALLVMVLGTSVAMARVRAPRS